jgi:purine-nucleoside phosphorylase
MIGALGADLVGMSTAVEAIAARHLGAELLGLSVVSNMAAGVGPDAIGITEIVDVSSRATSRLAELIDRILSSTD